MKAWSLGIVWKKEACEVRVLQVDRLRIMQYLSDLCGGGFAWQRRREGPRSGRCLSCVFSSHVAQNLGCGRPEKGCVEETGVAAKMEFAVASPGSARQKC